MEHTTKRTNYLLRSRRGNTLLLVLIAVQRGLVHETMYDMPTINSQSGTWVANAAWETRQLYRTGLIERSGATTFAITELGERHLKGIGHLSPELVEGTMIRLDEMAKAATLR